MPETSEQVALTPITLLEWVMRKVDRYSAVYMGIKAATLIGIGFVWVIDPSESALRVGWMRLLTTDGIGIAVIAAGAFALAAALGAPPAGSMKRVAWLILIIAPGMIGVIYLASWIMSLAPGSLGIDRGWASSVMYFGATFGSLAISKVSVTIAEVEHAWLGGEGESV